MSACARSMLASNSQSLGCLRLSLIAVHRDFLPGCAWLSPEEGGP
jgi:hypothetical protein